MIDYAQHVPPAGQLRKWWQRHGCFCFPFRTIGEWLPVAGRYTSAARRDALRCHGRRGRLEGDGLPRARDRATVHVMGFGHHHIIRHLRW